MDCCFQGLTAFVRPLLSFPSIAQNLARQNRPFDVFITTASRKLTAGFRTKLCTIRAEHRTGLRSNENQECLPKVSADISFDSNQMYHVEDRKDKLEITEWQMNSSQIQEKMIYFTCEQALEEFTLTISIANKRVKNFFYLEEFFKGSLCVQRSLAIYTCSYSILPTAPQNLFLKSYVSNQGIKSDFYRGSTVIVTAETCDLFGNMSGDRNLLINFKVSSEQLSMLSLEFLSRGLFQFTFECRKTGLAKTKIECKMNSGQTRYLEFKFEVKYPPPSSTFSRVVQEDLNRMKNSTYEAGTPIEFRVSMKDIYDLPLLKEEREVGIRAKFMHHLPGMSNEMSLFKCEAREHSNIYDITVILKRAGKTTLELFLTERDCTSPKLASVTLKVVPSKIASILLEPFQNAINKVFVNLPQNIKIKAFDNFGNSVLFCDKHNQTEMETTTRHKKSKTEIISNSNLQVDPKDGSGYCNVTFTSTGYHSVKVSLKESAGNCKLVVSDSLAVFVTLAPFSHLKSIIHLTWSVLQVTSGDEAQIFVKLLDIYNHPVSYSDLKSLNRKLPLTAAFVAKPNKQFSDLSSEKNESVSIHTTGTTGVYIVQCTPVVSGKRVLKILLHGKSISGAPVEICVTPSRLSKLQLENPHKFSNLLVNVPQKITVRAFDKYGNSVLFHDNDCQFDIETEIMTNCKIESNSKSKLHINAKDESGCCSVTFTSAGHHTLQASLKESIDGNETVATDSITVFVTLAPFSHVNSAVHLTRSNLRVKSGDEEKILVKVRDIYNHSVLKSDLQVLRQKLPLAATFLVGTNTCSCYHSLRIKENESISVEPSPKAGVYEIRFIPFISGKRTLIVKLNDKSISQSPVEVDVSPSHLSKVQSQLKRKDYKSEVLVNVPQTLKLTAFDEFGNIIPFNEPKRKFDFLSNIRSVSPEGNKLQSEGDSAFCTVTFLSAGRHSVKMLVRDCVFNVDVTDSLTVHAKLEDFSLQDVPEDEDCVVEEFDDETSCQLQGHGDSANEYNNITCYGFDKGKIIGPDHSRLKNINRAIGDDVLHNDDIKREKKRGEALVNIDTSCLPVDQVLKIYGLLLACLRGQFYREQGRRFDAKREEWKYKSQTAFQEMRGQEAQRCSQIKNQYSRLVTKCHRMASEEIFSFYNEGRGLQSIDLHELFAADESKLKEFYTQLLKNRGEAQALQIVAEARADQDEAITKLRKRLQQINGANEKPQWLEVIVGAGHHSRGKEKIKPKVKEFLKTEERNGSLPKAEEANEGSLVVTFQPYTGPEPCFGYYYCKKCTKSWCSQSSWVGKYQSCYRCHEYKRVSKCYPMKQSEFRQEGHRRGNPRGHSSKPADHHYQELCEMCQELGKYCGD